MKTSMQFSLSELAQRFALELNGDGCTGIQGICGITDNRAAHLAFVNDPRMLQPAADSQIPAFVTHPDHPVPGKSNLFHEHPDYLIARIAELFLPTQLSDMGGVSPSATIAASAEIGAEVDLGANVVVGNGVRIGPRTRVFPNVVIMDRCNIGADCVIYPNCTLREDTCLGDRVILQPGVALGGDGYGFVQHEGRFIKIPQLGRVVLEDDVEVGANTTIDRARFNETRIGRGTKIDNLVMLAHNVVTGEDCLLISQVGVSGSTRLGNRVVLGGQVGTVGHVNVADDVTVLGKGGITKDINEAGTYAGMPVRPARLWRRAIARLYAGLR
jgi:UDP-3-O-[3-hydroxymyristoyl] glucosamine N-acyltransferase